MMRHYARDPASGDNLGYRIPGLAHLLCLLAEDAAFADEVVRKVLVERAARGSGIGARLQEGSVISTACPAWASAPQDDRL